jgi:DNA-binding transcriptional regulator GbsR (MarR family)
MSPPAREAKHSPADWQRRFIERVGANGDVSGLPPSVVRVYAWLIVCEPAEQSVAQLCDALQLSTGAISAATSNLARMGIVERVVQPGSRKHLYRLASGGFERLLKLRLEATAHIRASADEALAEAPGRHPRLVELRDFYVRIEQLLTRDTGAARRR